MIDIFYLIQHVLTGLLVVLGALVCIGWCVDRISGLMINWSGLLKLMLMWAAQRKEFDQWREEKREAKRLAEFEKVYPTKKEVQDNFFSSEDKDQLE